MKTTCGFLSKAALAGLLAVIWASPLCGREIHVAMTGHDAAAGTKSEPLRSIQRAADLAQAGDVITVHEGIYRERVDPPRGGVSDAMRIIYQAAPGEKVTITGSEIVARWEKAGDGVWKAVLPAAFFGTFNPFADVIRGDWFDGKGREHHTGAVYLDGQWLAEARTRDEVATAGAGEGCWFAQVGEKETTVWARFNAASPEGRTVEVNVRRTVFYPSRTGVNFLTVRGFDMRNAATPWSPPTAEQVGLIGTNWSKGWIIENNTVSHSVCAGVALGKHGDEFDNQSANSAEGYVKTVERALKRGWNKETIGHHIVRNNTISDCEQTGVVGSLGGIFSRITGNTIHRIHVRRAFSGCEQAGIKLHGAIDVEISGNHIHHCCRGVWLDWMAQGARVSRNLFHDNASEADLPDWGEPITPGGCQDLFVEVNHGPFLVDNNLFLSPYSVNNRSQGGAYVHNLFAGAIRIVPHDNRLTPFHKAHSTEVAGLHDNPCGDDRYFNNLFVKRADLTGYAAARMPVRMSGNVFLNGAKPSKEERDAVVDQTIDPALALAEGPDGLTFGMTWDPARVAGSKRELVTTAMLGRTEIARCAWENPDGTPLRVDKDFFGEPRDDANPAPGPFAKPGQGKVTRKVR